ncbi:MAG: Ig-like domain-containing protein, partial [Candidatus Acidiferrales bacterium]
MIKFKRLVRFLPILSILGLSSCVSSFVKDLLITSVKITPANPTIATGATQQFSLVVTYVDGQTDHPSPSSTAWSSDNAAVATISKAGIATAIAAGTANIGGSYHGNDTTTVLTVTAPSNVAIALQGDSRVLEVTNLHTGQE